MYAANQRTRFAVLFLVLALCVPTAWAQQKDPRVNPPLGPITPGESSSKAPAENPGAPAPATSQDTGRPLSGVETFGLGGSGGTSYLKGSLQFTQGFDTNPGLGPGVSNITSQSTLHGSVDLQRIWSRYQFSASYATGGILYNNQGGNNTKPVHDFAFSQTIRGRRWTFLLADNFSYLPESSFGFGGFGGVGNLPNVNSGFSSGTSGNPLTTGQPGLNPFLLPSQTILFGNSTRISNSVVAQVQYTLSPRVSFTASGSFGMLHFLNPGLIDNRSTSFRTGWNYRLNGKDAIALIYGVNLIRFNGISRSVDNHNFHVGYGRRLSGRLAFSVSAGPSFRLFHNPVSGSGKNVTVSTQTSLQYRLHNADLVLAYARSMTGGSGLLLGAQSDTVEFSTSRQLSRMWDMGVEVGYARNSSLQQLQLTPGTVNFHFNAYRGGVTFSRPLGRQTKLFLNYNVEHQNLSGCVVATSCPGSTLRHHFALGLNWLMRPINLE